MIMLIKLGDLWKFRISLLKISRLSPEVQEENANTTWRLVKNRIGQVEVLRQSPQVQEENVNKTRKLVQTAHQASAAQCSAMQCST